MPLTGIFDRLSAQIVQLDHEGVKQTTREALASGASAQEIIAKGLGPGMAAIGSGYEQGEFFVPELMLSARAMRGALEILRPHLGAGDSGTRGTVVIGTVQGDVHEIGKNIVSIVLEGDGFQVHDLGEDVAPQEFLSRATELGAEVVAMSALISLAVSKMSETVALLKSGGFAGRVIVGGAAVGQETARSIGADAYAADAWAALQNVRALADEVRA